MKEFALAALIKTLFFILILPFTASAETRFSLGLGFDFSSGNYGIDIDADSYSTSLLLGYYPTERLGFGLIIPYHYQSSSTTITSGGIRFRTDSSGNRNGPGMGMRGDSAESGESRSGLGDLMFSAGYLLLKETAGLPQVRATGFIKFPTADESQQLGTGEYDYGAGLVISKWLNRWLLFGKGEAVSQGDDDRLGLSNFQIYEGGCGYQIGDNLLPTVSLWGTSSPAVGSPGQLEARAKLSYRLSERNGISGYALKGLTDSSPDYGLGGSFFYNF